MMIHKLWNEKDEEVE